MKEINLELDSLSKDAIEEIMRSSLRVMERMEAIQGEAFLATFIQYFHKNPSAILFVNGQVGQYTDQGYEGCFVSRVDSAYVQERAKAAIKSGDKYEEHLASQENFDKDVMLFKEKNGEYKTYSVLPKSLKSLAQEEFEVFSMISERVNGLERAWREVGDFLEEDSNGGMVYGKGDLGTIAKKLGVGASRFQELKGKVEYESLANGALGVSAKNKSPRKSVL